MKIKIKKLRPNAKMPTQGTKSAAGFDLYYAGDNHTFIPQHDTIRLETGIAFEIPEGYCGVVYRRSSTALKGLAITPLVVDSDYRGEVFVTVRNTTNEPHIVCVGDRLAQIKIEKLEPTEFEWAEELSQTERGTGGYGSTGR